MSGAGSGGLGTLCLTLGLIPTLAGRSGPSRGCLAERSDVRINQLGYLPGSPKRATWVTDEPLPVEFSVVTADGSVALRGLTQPWPNRPEPTSGQSVHVLDFTDLAAAGPGYQLLVAGPAKPSVPNCRGPLRPTRPQRPGIVLPAQIRLPDRRSPCPRLRPARRPFRCATESRRHRGFRLDWTRGRAPLSRMGANRALRCVRRLVRRRRLRQVHRQRQHRRVTTAQGHRTAPRRSRSSGSAVSADAGRHRRCL